jgi:hypothetical protein
MQQVSPQAQIAAHWHVRLNARGKFHLYFRGIGSEYA